MKGIVPLIAIVAIIVAILVALGVFNQPNIIMIRQTTDSTCPGYISGSFEVKFSNHGTADASLCVVLSSEVIEFKKYKDCLVVAPNSDKTTTFKFEIDINSIPKDSQNVSISYSWEYNKFFVLKHTSKPIECMYKVEYNRLTLIGS